MTPEPRTGFFYGKKISNSKYKEGTWLEGEEFAYSSPTGCCGRRAYALCADGKNRVINIGIPDTYFSIPGRATINGKSVRGYVHIDTDTEILMFNQYKG